MVREGKKWDREEGCGKSWNNRAKKCGAVMVGKREHTGKDCGMRGTASVGMKWKGNKLGG